MLIGYQSRCQSSLDQDMDWVMIESGSKISIDSWPRIHVLQVDVHVFDVSGVGLALTSLTYPILNYLKPCYDEHISMLKVVMIIKESELLIQKSKVSYDFLQVFVWLGYKLALNLTFVFNRKYLIISCSVPYFRYAWFNIQSNCLKHAKLHN